MAKANSKTQQLIAVLVFFFLFIFATSSVSSARLLNGFLSHGLAATEPTLNLVIPLEVDVVFGKPASTSDSEEQEYPSKPQVLLPRDHIHKVPTKNTHVDHMVPSNNILWRPPRLAGKYGPMVLNMLPRGPITPSGPSKGTNDIKN